MKLEHMPSERSQAQKVTLFIILLYKNVHIGKSMKTESRSVVVKGWGVNAIGNKGFGKVDKIVLELDNNDD